MKPNNSKYTYFIGIGERDLIFKYTEVSPINTDNLSISSSKEEGRIFRRRKLQGSPVLVNNDNLSDYTLMKQIEADTINFPIRRFVFLIKKNGVEFWKGFFNAITCKFDDDRCTCTIDGVEVWDKYSCLYDYMDKKYNLIDIDEIHECYCANPQELRETKTFTDIISNCRGIFAGGSVIAGYNFLPTEIGGNPDYDYAPKDTSKYANMISQGYGCYYWKWELINRANKTFRVTSKWARRTLVLTDDGTSITYPDDFQNWQLLEATTLAGLPAHKFYNLEYRKNLTAQPPIKGVDGYQPITITDSSLVTTTYQLPIRFWRWNANFNQQLYKQNRSFISMIEQIVLDCGLHVRSDFFFNTQNYVTGVSLNPLNNLLVSAKRDIKRYEADEPSLTAHYTLKDIEAWLLNMFNAYWFIDSDGYFRIEHLTYFKKIAGLNLKTLANGRYIKATNKYNYDKNDIAIRERWEFMEAKNTDFIGEDIVYYNDGILKEADKRAVKSFNIPIMTTDIDYIKTEPSAISEDGFVMFACRINENNEFEVLNEDGLLSNNFINNAHLSLANLMYYYHRHGRCIKAGYLNKEYIEFLSTKKIKKQTDLQFLYCEQDFINEDELITTTLGDGEILEADLNLKTNMMKVVLIY